MDADRRNDTGIFRYADVEYTPEGHTDAYRWDDFLGIAGGHVYSAMDTIDMVSTGGQYEGDEPEHAYACEIVGCCGLSDGVALFRPVSHDGADLIQIAFLRNEVDDATGAYTERFEAGSFDLPAADLPRSEFGVDLLEYFSGRSFKYTPGVSRGLDPREAVDSIEDAIGCDLGLFDGFWLGVPGEADMRVGPYTKKSLLDFSYYAKELSCRYGFADSDILEIARHLPDECPDCLAAVKAYLDCEYVPDGNAPDEKTYRWGDFLEIAGGDARYAAMLVDRTAAGEPEAGLHPETLVDQDIRDGEAFMLAGRLEPRSRRISTVDIDFGKAFAIANHAMLNEVMSSLDDPVLYGIAERVLPNLEWRTDSIAIDAINTVYCDRHAEHYNLEAVRIGIPGGPRVRDRRRSCAHIGKHRC